MQAIFTSVLKSKLPEHFLEHHRVKLKWLCKRLNGTVYVEVKLVQKSNFLLVQLKSKEEIMKEPNSWACATESGWYYPWIVVTMLLGLLWNMNANNGHVLFIASSFCEVVFDIWLLFTFSREVVFKQFRMAWLCENKKKFWKIVAAVSNVLMCICIFCLISIKLK